MKMEITISGADAEKIIADEIRRRLGNLVSPTQTIEIELPRYNSGDVKITVAAEVEPAPIPPPPSLQEHIDRAELDAKRSEAAREDAERMRRETPADTSMI